MFMLNLEYLDSKKNQNFLIKIIKIIILGFVSFSLLASAIPFYLGFDDVNYGIASINLSNGNISITNELLQKTNLDIFVPYQYVITSDTKSAVPVFNVGIYSLGALSYLIGGFYGLLYVGPIITIILLIFYERITSKYFGSLVGLLALLFLVADWQIFFVGLRLLTDNVFTLFFILGVFSIIKFLHTKDDRYILLCSTFFAISTLIRLNGGVFLFTEIIIISGFFSFQYFKKLKEFNKQINENNYGIILTKQIFSKSNFKRFLKISFFLLLPWLMFLAFWFSYNDYYFDDASTNYREQIQSNIAPIYDETDPLSVGPKPPDVSGNQFERIKLAQYYAVPLIPDPLYFFLVITSDTDLDAWRSDIWISYVTLSVLSVSLILSHFFKIKRIEVFTMILFIISLVGFFSSPIVAQSPQAIHLSEHANNRYMIPTSSLSFILLGFILVEFWRKISSNHPKNQKKWRSLKIFYLLFILVFFSALIAVMPAIQDLYQRGPHFNNPIEYFNFFKELEKLPPNSIIVGHGGRNSLMHTDTHYFLHTKKTIQEKEAEIGNILNYRMNFLKEILSEGYAAYTYKQSYFPLDAEHFKILEEQHGIILKDYSQTFCKMELIFNTEESSDNYSSDPICYQDIGIIREKIWPVTLKWPS